MSGVFRNSIISSLIAIAVYLYIYYSESIGEPNWKEEWLGLLLAIFLVNLIGLALMNLNKWFNKRIPWNKQITIRFGVEIVSGILLSVIAAFVFFYAYVLRVHIPSEEIPTELYHDGILKFGILSLVLVYGYSVINFSSFSYNQYSKGQLESLSAERIQLELRFEALKSQLNPHFLFNALNTISSLIYTSSNQAEEYIRQLAKTYNYILDTNGNHLVRLADEIEMLKAYFYMHKIKFNDRVELKIDEHLERTKGYIPPFTFQILVENAIKHNEISEQYPLTIEIYKDKKSQLIVKNNCNSIPKQESDMEPTAHKNQTESYKIGLLNIRKRYKYILDTDVKVTEGESFVVSLPFIHSPELKKDYKTYIKGI